MKRYPSSSGRGFTLIELLIVVAIVAVLAAIAVPNFLEAQMRSKTGRMQADMRTAATALEAYAVDYDRYPLYLNSTDYLEGPGEVETFLPTLLTTPVSYLSKLPNDLFSGKEGVRSLYYKHDYVEPYMSVTNEDDEVKERALGYLFIENDSLHWVLWSRGPDTEESDGKIAYDPTNGTTSKGDLDRFGP